MKKEGKANWVEKPTFTCPRQDPKGGRNSFWIQQGQRPTRIPGLTAPHKEPHYAQLLGAGESLLRWPRWAWRIIFPASLRFLRRRFRRCRGAGGPLMCAEYVIFAPPHWVRREIRAFRHCFLGRFCIFRICDGYRAVMLYALVCRISWGFSGCLHFGLGSFPICGEALIGRRDSETSPPRRREEEAYRIAHQVAARQPVNCRALSPRSAL